MTENRNSPQALGFGSKDAMSAINAAAKSSLDPQARIAGILQGAKKQWQDQLIVCPEAA
jgi:hypothetical protein